MKVNFGFDQFKDLEGTVLSYYKSEEDSKADKKTNMSLGFFCVAVLKKGREKDSGEQKFDDWELARNIKASDGEMEVTAEEASRLKQLIGQYYGPEVVGPAWGLLDGNADPYSESKKRKKK